MPKASETGVTSTAWLRRLKALECPDSTYAPADNPLVFARARGSKIYDPEGREYIDLCAGFGVLALGHNPAAHASVYADLASAGEAAAPPMVHGMGDVYPSTDKVRLLEALISGFEGRFGYGALALTGAQAVEIAVKTAFIATGRSGVIAFQHGYHGLDLGILPLTYRKDFRDPFTGYLNGSLECVRHVPYRCDPSALHSARSALLSRGADVAAVIVEPVQGRGGIRPGGRTWLEALRRFCDETGALLIYDEVFTGLGRTGRMSFSAEVAPDLLCLGKALGGGMPLSACLGTAGSLGRWPESRGEALHTGTFFGHPLSCRIGLATLCAIQEQNLPGRAADLGREIVRDLQRMTARTDRVVDVRGEGLMIGIQLARSGDGAQLMDLLRSRGVVALASGPDGDVLSITPALNIDEQLLATAVGRVSDAILALPS